MKVKFYHSETNPVSIETLGRGYSISIEEARRLMIDLETILKLEIPALAKTKGEKQSKIYPALIDVWENGPKCPGCDGKLMISKYTPIYYFCEGCQNHFSAGYVSGFHNGYRKGKTEKEIETAIDTVIKRESPILHERIKGKK